MPAITDSDITFTHAESVASGLVSGTLTITGTTNYPFFGIALSDVVEVVTITFPDTSTYELTINPAVSRSGSIPFPTTNGVIDQGTYGFTMVATVGGGVTPGDYTSDSVDYDFCPGALSPKLTPTTNCACAIFTVTDQTSYGEWTVTARSMNIIGPTITGATPVYTVNGFGPAISTSGMALYRDTYQYNMTVTVTSGSITMTFTVKNVAVQIDCATICKLYCVLETMVGKWSGPENRNTAEATRAKDAWLLALGLAKMAEQSMNCNAGDDMATYVDLFWGVVKPFSILPDSGCCDCCDDSNIIQPVCGAGGASGIIAVTAGPSPYLTSITTNGSVVITLSASAVALLNAIRATTITSPDSSVTVGNVVSGTPGGTNAFTLVTPFNENHYSMLVTFTGTTLTAGTPTVRRSGNVWTAGAPTLNPVTVAYWTGLRIGGILLSGTRQLYATATIVGDQPVKSRQIGGGSFPLNDVIRATALVSNGTSNYIDIAFYDLGSDPLLGEFITNFNATGIGAQVTAFTLQVDIWT